MCTTIPARQLRRSLGSPESHGAQNLAFGTGFSSGLTSTLTQWAAFAEFSHVLPPNVCSG